MLGAAGTCRLAPVRARQAERYEEQARQARARSTRGYGSGPRAQQHEYQEARLETKSASGFRASGSRNDS